MEHSVLEEMYERISRSREDMTQDIQNFIQYLHKEKQISVNTEVSYARDLKKMNEYLLAQGVTGVQEVTAPVLDAYVLYLEKEGRKPATISRNIASMKAFYHYLGQEKRIASDPSERLRAPRIEKRQPVILTPAEVTRLLEQPGGKTPKDLRDRAMLELLYATGIRVSELVSLRLPDVKLVEQCLVCAGAHGERRLPFGTVAAETLERYLLEGRAQLVNENTGDWLFTNCSGGVMSRQGFWKLIKAYGKKAGICAEITPHMLRRSFAAHMVSGGMEEDAVQELPEDPAPVMAPRYAQIG